MSQFSVQPFTTDSSQAGGLCHGTVTMVPTTKKDLGLSIPGFPVSVFEMHYTACIMQC